MGKGQKNSAQMVKSKKRTKKQQITRKKPLQLDTMPRRTHSEISKSTSELLYWITLLVLLICNFLVALVLMPFLLATTRFELYIVIIILGLFFGFLFNLLITNIENLEKKHHVIAAIFIPLIAVIDLHIIIKAVNKIAYILQLPIHQNAVVVASVYVIALLTPYLVLNVLLKKR
ncbi:MAG: hypothetical protein GY861_26510 [bacterium]|nr:hypothetical protein [bacterium]